MTITNYFSNMTGIKEMLSIPNSQTGGWFWFGMLIMIFVILVINFLGFGFETAIVTSAFVGLITGLFLNYLDLVSWQWLMLFLGIILFMLFYIVWSNRKHI